MSDEKKKKPDHPETFFLPPLKMILSFFDKDKQERENKQKDDETQEKTVEKNVSKLIEKLSEKKDE